ncbi:PEP-CTERM sorting domain-containing protein [Adhaeretor mobilis]|uniref:PEP-CTERM protein-sorting domain-containing protein n=1 Tax=Adhaeretor mobilis TaxID=1930276 RepID=A0A517MTN5_9BACT|nr:PEP-CTERM sorting domain-containing protein [Adhaeretor mobilis]QDS98238.1 hypothetical protein HG15A2_15110 [Adhaeretor mobilis]
MHYRIKQLAIRHGLGTKKERNRTNSRVALLAVAIAMLMTTPSSAVIQTFTDLASWQAAISGPTFLEDFEGQVEDDFFGTGSATSPNGQLQLSANANFNDNAIIDVSPFVSTGADINGNVVVNMRFLDGGAGANPQETVTVGLLPGISAFAFEFNNYDSAGDGSFLSFEGTNGGTVPAFDSTVNGFFGVVDTGVGATIDSFSFTGDPAVGTGFSAFNSFDDVRYTEPHLLKARIDIGTGLTEIVNDFATSQDFDYYSIDSTTDDLNFASWNSFSDQAIDAIDGPDPDATVGNGTGEKWDEAGGADDGALSELFLLGSSVFGANRTETLGNAFKVGGDTDSLSFEYRRASDGALFDGVIELVGTAADADFDGSGTVDGNDFLTWQDNFGLAGQTDNSNGDADGSGTVDGLDLDAWGAQYGSPSSLASSVAAAASVPEPTTGCLLSLALAATMLNTRRRVTS